MSRNARPKYPQTPVKAAKRRGSDTTASSSLYLSDDDEGGYSGVEDVSDSDDDDEEHVFAAEEEHIINYASRKRSPPRPPVLEDDDADEEAEDDDETDEEDDDHAAEDNGEDNVSWDGILSDRESTTTEQVAEYLHEQELASVERHVRFTGVPDSDSDSTTSENSEDHEEFFPDIFIDQNSLDPAFRRQIENDEDDSSTSGSFWDFTGSSQQMFDHPASDDIIAEESDNTPIATPMPSGVVSEMSTPTASGEVQELDGYESDGETTEEDVPDPVVRRKQMRRFSHTEQSPDSELEKAMPFRRGRPRVGRFNLDHSEKPIAVLNHTTRKMMIFTPQRRNRLDHFDHLAEPYGIDLASQDLTLCSPLITHPGHLMMGAMFSSNTFGDFMNTIGPAEAFFPLTSDPPMDVYSSESEFPAPEEDDDEEETKLRLEDFVTFHHDSSDEEDEDDGGSEWDGNLASSPPRPQTAASGASAATDSSAVDLHPLLSHFDNNSDAVGAFRRNQINQQLIFSDKASQESLAFSAPYHYGTLRGIKSGSMETVTTPITPARRHRRTSTLQGPDAQASPSQKRKASSQITTDSFHKKQRSISDMDLLQL